MYFFLHANSILRSICTIDWIQKVLIMNVQNSTKTCENWLSFMKLKNARMTSKLVIRKDKNLDSSSLNVVRRSTEDSRRTVIDENQAILNRNYTRWDCQPNVIEWSNTIMRSGVSFYPTKDFHLFGEMFKRYACNATLIKNLKYIQTWRWRGAK